MKSIDTVIQAFQLVIKNPKIMAIGLIGNLVYLLLLISLMIPLVILMYPSLSSAISTLLSAISSNDFSELDDPSILAPLTTFLIFAALLSVILEIFVWPIFSGMTLNAGIQAIKGKVSLKKAFNEAKKKYFSLLGVELIGIFSVLLLVGLCFIPLLLLFISKVSEVVVLLISLLFVFLLVFGLFVFIILFFESWALVFTENRKAIEAIKRSIYIGKKKFLSIIGVISFLSLISSGIGVIIRIIQLFPSLFFELLGLTLFRIIFEIFLNFIVGLFTGAVGGILPVVFYYTYKEELK
ncbi:MAG: hypothetical protein ACPLXS_02210 [Candidatus Micrarchaeales archaeon]